MVAQPIHNLKVAGLKLEGGNIFSERYLARKGCGLKGGTRMMDNEMQQNWNGRNNLCYYVFRFTG